MNSDRLSTTDETGRRVFLYPAFVRGRFKNRKQITHFFLLLFFLLLPWIRVNNRQAVFLNIADRSFSVFGFFFRGHDAPLLVFLLIGFAILIAFITALWGRAWCGWACPQTVFIEFLFRRLETWIEGPPRTRKELDDGPWTSTKILRKGSKWLAFLIVSLLITHSFLAYFVGSHEVLQMMAHNPTENWTSFLVVLVTTGIILFDFGWFREQFCVIMCPYGRMQSVLLDNHSIVVAYDAKRGEPRRDIKKTTTEAQGDCVDCLRCVQVCPTGIDIRRGVQMECIACTACIDACDEVMSKVKKDPGLIRYTSQAALQGRKTVWFRPRTYAYLALLTIIASGFIFMISSQERLESVFLRAVDAPYQSLTAADGSKIITNHFIADLSNQGGSDLNVDLLLTAQEIQRGVELILPMRPVHLVEHAQSRVSFFVRFPAKLLVHGNTKMQVQVSSGKKIWKTEEINLVGPTE